CGGKALMSQITVGSKHMDCGMPGMDMDTAQDSEQEKQLKAEPCCENHYQRIEVKDDYHKSNIVQLNINVDFAIALVHTFLTIAPFAEADKPQYLHYSPPLLLRNIAVLNQVFII